MFVVEDPSFAPQRCEKNCGWAWQWFGLSKDILVGKGWKKCGHVLIRGLKDSLQNQMMNYGVAHLLVENLCWSTTNLKCVNEALWSPWIFQILPLKKIQPMGSPFKTRCLQHGRHVQQHEGNAHDTMGRSHVSISIPFPHHRRWLTGAQLPRRKP